MAQLVFDTHDFINKLTKAGFEEAQAKALSDGLKEVDLKHVATKEDVLSLNSQMVDLTAKMETGMANLRAEMHELKSGLLQWFIGILLAHAALVAAVAKYLF